MKWLLITAALNTQMVYDEEAVCRAAAFEIMRGLQQNATCIPQGADKSEESFKRFSKMLQSFSEGMKSE
jgi:hypothetical protein